MKVLVMGGNGFIGSHVVDVLIEAGHQVRIYDRAEDKYRNRLKGVDYVYGRFDDQLMLSEALTDIEVVFHGISTTVPSTSNLDPVSDVHSNLIATIQLLKIMIDKSIHRILFISSGGTVYGQADDSSIKETHSLNPICSYGIVKVAIENYLYMYQSLYGLKPIVLRVSNPYGERQGRLGIQGVISTFLNKINNNDKIEIWGDGSVIRDFIYVKDLALACQVALESEICGVFNIGGGVGHSIQDVLNCILCITGSEIKPVYKLKREFDVPRVVLDISEFKSKFNWQPVTPLMQGIEITWNWYKKISR